MKNILVGFLLFGLVSGANAAFTRDSGDNYATDDTTGLDWLALSETAGLAYNDAASLNSGWRYATNTEVTAMFSSLFSQYANENTESYSDNYANIIAEVNNFQSLFGYAYSYTTGNTATTYYYSLGLYLDETNSLNFLGAYKDSLDVYRVFGTNETYDRSFYLTTGTISAGTYLVRSSVSVPEGASAMLFAFGWLGLFRIARRKA